MSSSRPTCSSHPDPTSLFCSSICWCFSCASLRSICAGMHRAHRVSATLYHAEPTALPSPGANASPASFLANASLMVRGRHYPTHYCTGRRLSPEAAEHWFLVPCLQATLQNSCCSLQASPHDNDVRRLCHCSCSLAGLHAAVHVSLAWLCRSFCPSAVQAFPKR